ncbi:MAG: cell envelope integrity protein TolA [Pseudomonadota bacterium]
MHFLLIMGIILIPNIRLKEEKSTSVIWVQIPKGTSSDINWGMPKSANLPRSTIEQQKNFKPGQVPKDSTVGKTTDKAKEPSKSKMTLADKAKKTDIKKAPPKKISAADRKIAAALAMIDKDLASRQTMEGAPPEAAQVDDSGEGYIYGTGTEPVRVAPDDVEYIEYQAKIRALIIQEWVLPLRYVEEGAAPRKCILEVMINQDGYVFSTKWNKPSGDNTFDASALRAVKKSSPFPKPPERLAWEAYNEGFLIEFDPRLKPQY